MEVIQQMRKLNLSPEQQMVATMLMIDPYDKTIPTIKNPEWVDDLGTKLHELIKNKKLDGMYYDIDGTIRFKYP